MSAPSSTLTMPPFAGDNRRLHIAMIAPPYFSVPPEGYGGVEAVIADLVDGLVDRGHHVTLIGAGQNGTRAQRFYTTSDVPCSERLGEPLTEVAHAAAAARIVDELDDVDLVHDHTLAGPLAARRRVRPTVATTHGPVDGEPGRYYASLGESVPLIAISDAQRSSAPNLCWLATVHNAVRAETFPFRAVKEEFALFLGRFHPDKAPHLAIDAARRADLPIVLAGKCSEPIERTYYAREIEPRLGPGVTIYGVADARAKRDLLARACCLVFPVCWEEPFGLVMIEAMACGTPVVALRRGAVPEIVAHGQTGVIVDLPDELAGAIAAARRLEARACRQHVVDRFNTRVMAASYERAYRSVLESRLEVDSLALSRVTAFESEFPRQTAANV